ncbi:MAG: DNA-methyltransferase [Candidatus Helarchaeota archaeon]
MTIHKIFIADCRDMSDLEDNSVQLVVTSPPYYNAPFDYENMFKSYDEFLSLIHCVAKEIYRVLDDGRICAINCDDMLVDGVRYPIVSDVITIFLKNNFKYRDRITWKKPEGYIRISRRSGVILQNPYPMYYYPDNLLESIIIFQKGNFNYKKFKLKNKSKFEQSKIDLNEFQKNKWYLNLWEMTNVLPIKRIEKNENISVAAFPDELPYRIIKLYSFIGETVLDPFLGSGTTTKVAIQLKRNSIGYEINPDLIDIIKQKINYSQKRLDEYINNEKIEIKFIIKK